MKRAAILLGVLFVGGCTVYVPPTYEVKDVGSGKRFTTYPQWGKENMLGYNFYDIQTGERVMLKGYTRKTIDHGGNFKPDSPEAMEYQANVKRVEADKN